MKIQFGSGGNRIEGWLNTDLNYNPPDDVDISKLLPFPDTCATAVYASHCAEHLTAPDAFRFFKECFRILKPNGIARICVPSISRVENLADEKYLHWLEVAGFGDSTLESAISNQLLHHGHLSAWSEDVLCAALRGAGFCPYVCELQKSSYKELRGLERHGSVIGEHNAWVESIVVEGWKP